MIRLLQGSSNPGLCRTISESFGIKPLQAETKRFPDGELYCRLLEEVQGAHVVLVQSTYPDRNALEFLILSKMLRDQGASRIIGVIPYFGYARQDKVFKTGESFTARTMAFYISRSIDDLITVNLHKETTLNEFPSWMRKANVSVMPAIGAFMKGKADLILSPDKGAIPYAKEAASVAGCPYDHLEKTRIDGATVVMADKKLNVKGGSVCIVDDIIATGGTIARASETLRKQGASKVYACCVHGLFTGNGIEKLSPFLDDLYSSDTIENPKTAISAAGAIGDRLRAWGEL